MIGSLQGVVRGFLRDTVVIDVGGVGYRVASPVSTLTKLSENDPVFLWTHLAVRENSQDLYGFETKDELHWFELLLSVSGIGPKSALAILNTVDTVSLEKTIATNDPAGLSKAHGVGKKTAEKIVLELKGKIGGGEARRAGESDGDVIDALVGLGYSVREAREAVRAVPKETQTTEARIREAIRIASNTGR
ncbi:Holliday junction branch migration protein RuvA [Patescibacteria group bacterium]|nr:Holliday junction branch migration protein RuvA [Patescibacteria group bacterium]